MKKFTVLALAAALAIPAFAVAPQAKSMKSAEAQLSTMAPMQLGEVKAQRVKANKSINAVSDLFGLFETSYIWGLKSDDPFGGVICPMVKEGELPNEVLFNGLPYSDIDLKATVDLSAKTVTFQKQDLFFNTNYNEMVVLQPERWSDDGQSTTQVDKLVGHIQDDGTILFDQMDCMTFRISQGYFFFIYAIEMKPVNFFEFNSAEWAEAGNAEFTDNYLNNLFVEEYQVTAPQTLKCFVKHGSDNKVIAFENPYATEDFSVINPGAQLNMPINGYYVIDMTNEECVLLQPYVGTGMYANFGSEEQDDYQQVFCYNDEAKYVLMNGFDYQDVIDEYGAVGIPLSNYNSSNSTATIMNLWFGPSTNPIGSYWFGEDADVWLQFVLPDISGIDGVEVNENAPVRYFNLQGMEVVNPVKGQLVIKTQGNKAQKVIVK